MRTMTAMDTVEALRQQVCAAREFDRAGHAEKAHAAWEIVARLAPYHPEAATRLAKFAMERGDAASALKILQPATFADPGHQTLPIDLAFVYLHLQQPLYAIAELETTVQSRPDHVEAWLLLGEIREVEGNARGALKAWYQAVTRAQQVGRWHSAATTPAHLLDAVMHAIATVRGGRRELLFGSLDDISRQFGASELRRVQRALTGFLGDWDATPPDKRQRPKFLYFPDLPATPFLDPALQPWSARLQDAFPVIRDEALRALEQKQSVFADFVQLTREGVMADFVAGDGPAPAWEAFFFYRRGKRYDTNHQRCPQTSEVLESLDLCRISDQTPEVCFSLLKPGSHILPHFGVSNTRTVMHLPLVVPADCALHLLGVGEHRWREGELMMFDDTFEHEAWNRSAHHRLILLMDCWNPHLTLVERMAVTQLIETLSGLTAADNARPAVAN